MCFYYRHIYTFVQAPTFFYQDKTFFFLLRGSLLPIENEDFANQQFGQM